MANLPSNQHSGKHLTTILLVIQVVLLLFLIVRLRNVEQILIARLSSDTRPTAIFVDGVTPGNGYSLGPDAAPITIIEFSDFECPYCAQAAASLPDLLKNYPDEVRLIYRHFPLPSHPNAIRLALAAECAGEQGKFWQMHDAIFLGETELDEISLISYVPNIGMDKIAFERCLSSEKYLEKIQEDIEAGEKYEVSGTPTFFINGYRVMGFSSDILEQLIEQELGK